MNECMNKHNLEIKKLYKHYLKRFSIYGFHGKRTSYIYFLNAKNYSTMFLETLSRTDKSCDKQLSNLQDLRYILSDKEANITYNPY